MYIPYLINYPMSSSYLSDRPPTAHEAVELKMEMERVENQRRMMEEAQNELNYQMRMASHGRIRGYDPNRDEYYDVQKLYQPTPVQHVETLEKEIREREDQRAKQDEEKKEKETKLQNLIAYYYGRK